MPEETRPGGGLRRPESLARLAELLGLGRDSAAALLAASLDAIQSYTRRQLLDWARRLGLTGVHDLGKEALAARFHQALQRLGTALVPWERAEADPAPVERADLAHKFELGPSAPTEPAPRHIPWAYGQDRVTAMAVDPDRLYAYFEVTDEAIARTRPRLGAAGDDAWLNLRVYDVTGRLFDGTNALGYVDHRIARTDRQWFFHVGRPGSTACVEIGLRSHEGYFVRIARSGRVDFPRRAPAPPGPVEWLTVREAMGGEASAEQAGVSWAQPEHRGNGHEPADGWRAEWEGRPDEHWNDGDDRLEWSGPVVQTSWEAGPFPFSVESPVYVEERRHGDVRVVVRAGITHVVYGPWEVTIRGLQGWAERRILAVWELVWSWVAGAGTRVVTIDDTSVGASEGRFASELRWASEVRLGGASEVYRLGASERRYLGASETLGGSEARLRGASDWAYGGGSAHLAGGSGGRPAVPADAPRRRRGD